MLVAVCQLSLNNHRGMSMMLNTAMHIKRCRLMHALNKVHTEIQCCNSSTNARSGNAQHRICQRQHHASMTDIAMIKMLRRVQLNAHNYMTTLNLINMHTKGVHKMIFSIHRANIGRNILDQFHRLHRLSSDSKK